MAKYHILKAVEFDKTSAKFRKQYGSVQALADDGGWMVQLKYDGCFAKITVEGGIAYMESRTGESVRSCEHIVQEFHGRPDCVVLGEVWSGALSFPEISGRFRRHSAAPDLHFIINDLLPVGMVTDKPYISRHTEAVELARQLDCRFIDYAVPAPPAAPGSCAVERARMLAAQGAFDGLILRRKDAGYSIGDAKNGEIVKVKPTLSLDLRVVDYDVERGAKTGRLVTTLIVTYNGVRTTVGSGVPHEFCGEGMLDRIVEIECLGVTEDGKLREPRYKGIRHDKVDTDG